MGVGTNAATLLESINPELIKQAFTFDENVITVKIVPHCINKLE